MTLLPPLLYLFACLLLFLSAFVLCSFLLPLWSWEISPMGREPPPAPSRLLVLFVSPTPTATHLQTPGLCQGPGVPTISMMGSTSLFSASALASLPLPASYYLPSLSPSLWSPSAADRDRPQPLRGPVSIPVLCPPFLGSRTRPQAHPPLNGNVNLVPQGEAGVWGTSVLSCKGRGRGSGSDSCLCRGLSVCDRQSHWFISQSLR